MELKRCLLSPPHPTPTLPTDLFPQWNFNSTWVCVPRETRMPAGFAVVEVEKNVAEATANDGSCGVRIYIYINTYGKRAKQKGE